MLRAASRREFTILLVANTDRLSRKLGKLLALKEQLKQYGVTIIRPGRPSDDTPETRLFDNIEGVFAEYQREWILIRTLNGKREKAESGKVLGSGPPPYGRRYARETLSNGKTRVASLADNPLTTPIALRILRDLRTKSTDEIARALNAEGINGPRGKRWNPSADYRVGIDPSNCGAWVYGKHGQPVGPDGGDGLIVAPVPPTIDRDEWHEIQGALARRVSLRRAERPAEDPYLLRGRLTCAHCGTIFHIQPSSGVRYY